jgi:peptidoglycan/xylan/chitin deacetylase (PgdA/CDA1 family)
VSPERFERHLRLISRWGYSAITPWEWVEWRAGCGTLPRQPIILTFDDGYADLAEHAFPRLIHHGFKSSVFIVSGQIGGRNNWDSAFVEQKLLGVDAMRHWCRNGIDFGAHSRTHRDLTRLSDEALQEEVSGSATDLEELLGIPVRSFAYPYGQHNQRVREHVGRRFCAAFTTEEGLNRGRGDPMRLRRTAVLPDDTFLDLLCRCALGYDPLRVCHFGLRLRSRLLGR